MAPLLHLFVLLYQTVLTDAVCSVPGCNSTFCDENRCTQCIYPYVHTNTNSCSQCYVHCRRCDGKICYRCSNFKCNYACDIAHCPTSSCSAAHNVVCPNCPDGFYKRSANSHCYRCLNTGCKCSLESNCTDCLPGRFDTASNCIHTCPDECITCTDADNCSKCKPGKYGSACASDCLSPCPNGSCDKDYGDCLSRCSFKEYWDESKGTCASCKPRCSNCMNFTLCTLCLKTYYWGPVCEYDCVGCYGACDKNTGCSRGCDDKYYITEVNNTFKCTRCPETCKTCTNPTLCNICETGYWGSVCQYNCTACDNSCDKSKGCVFGCKLGHFQKMTSIGLQCFTCSDYCEICSAETDCQKCSEGYYLTDNNTCDRCSDNCQNGKCNQFNGSCLDGCVDEYTGERCETKCPSNCLQCDVHNYNACSLCAVGFYGENCNQCSMECKKGTEMQPCYQGNGTCKYGCEDGYWGTMCSKQCSNRCHGSRCNDTTGNCLNGCSATYYGQRCEHECSRNCVIDSVSPRLCNELDGSCQKGCYLGFYGINCSEKCGNCRNMVCFRQNGTCALGCSTGFTGVKCNEEIGSQESPLSGDNDSGGSIGVYAGAAAGAVAVIVLFIIAILLLKRRNRKAFNKKEGQDDSLCLESASGNLGKEDNTYATITDSNTKDEVDIIPGAMKVVPSEVSSSILTKTLDMADHNGAIMSKESRKEAPEDLTEKDAISDCLPDLEEVPDNVQYNGKQCIEIQLPVENTGSQVKNVDDIADENLEVQSTENYVDEEGNTYYNTVGKRVAVSDLADYIRKKDNNMLLEEFNKLPRGLLKDYNVAKNQRNASKNRYKMIYPYDESRVILKDGANDYVNASFIQGYNKPKEYIGSSGPFQRGTHDNGTVADFWRMVWQEKCETIVMLTKCFESQEHKCEQYWPELGQSKEYAKLNVSCVTEDQYADFTIRSFVVIKDGQTLNSRHLHFTAWPDKGVPADVTSMIEYRQKVRSLNKDAKSPMLVHCSAGIGRTGTFIALDMLTFMGEARGYVDMFGCVANLRFHRTNLVQTPEQYEYLHYAILHALTFDCKSITGEKFIETYSRLIKKKDGKSQLETQFQKLQSTIDEMSVEDKAAVNRNKALVDKNREGADIPGDENRVRLFENMKANASDYVNALFINGFRSRNKFIAAQTPLPATVIDFLSLIFQVKCSCVVMMEETDFQDKTVGVYWPADNQVIKHGVFQVACKESKTTSSYTVKTLSVKRKVGKKEEEQDVSLFIYTNWPKDAAVPKSSDSLIQLVKDVDTKNNRQDDEKPILIHCMTGAERSCLYCAVSVLIEKMEIEHEVSVVNTLRQIKARRRSSLPTLDQYKFCHQAVISYIQTFDIYSNFGLKSK